MNSVESKSIALINKKKPGSVFVVDDFSNLGSSEAVRVALHRIEKRGELKRIARGIYASPKHHKFFGEILPSTEEVAETIAKRDRIKLKPTGSLALNKLGLSTQVPTRIVFLTDGSSRKIRVGKGTITFIRTTPKNMMTKGPISGLVIQALKEIGKENLTEDEENSILKALKSERSANIQHDMALAPVWIRTILKKSLS